MPGVLNGAMILKRISILEAPSQYAASSSSTGIFSKYAFNSHIEVGIQNAIPGTIIAKYVFKRSKYLNSLNKGINNTAPENIFTAKRTHKLPCLNGKLNLAYEYAAGITNKSVKKVTVIAIKKLLKIYLPKRGTVFHISLYAQKDRSSE